MFKDSNNNIAFKLERAASAKIPAGIKLRYLYDVVQIKVDSHGKPTRVKVLYKEELDGKIINNNGNGEIINLAIYI